MRIIHSLAGLAALVAFQALAVDSCLAAGQPQQEAKRAESAGVKPARYAQEALDRLGRALVDAPSARFEGVFLSVGDDGSDSLALCGRVNAKNRMGGYHGFEPFIVAPGMDPWLPASGDGDWRFVWQVWCMKPVHQVKAPRLSAR